MPDLHRKNYYKIEYSRWSILILYILFTSCEDAELPASKNSKYQYDTSKSIDNSEVAKVYNQYKDGKKEGLWRTYYDNGQLKDESIYVSGKKEGLCKGWWENGKLSSEEFYENDKINGAVNWYNMQGEGHIAGTGNMRNGKRDGIWKICDIHEETTCIEASFKTGQKDGPWRVYFNSGQLKNEEIWKANELISKVCWDENGNVITCH